LKKSLKDRTTIC